ncbi:hypothetical protein CANCADRAFT_24944 [Tortispora caseinolytica NRRL Y-17796]|uniref:Uncharacterized protein n=1 Tax=Tortispora caseinolytica NRRL Y-17796 TaxID=767744 RepID=A0A1E4TEI9_9ASCO|nr:hypothetical protein CANCADRAFT_24944 [Tortispora caseinolytica NRRL Y-17796]
MVLRLARKYSSSAAVRSAKPLRSVMVANRGEITHRVADTAANMGIKVTAIYTEPDSELPFATEGPTNASIGSASDGYLKMDEIIRLAKETNSEAIHPGYGFLSENAIFAKKVRDAGLIFVGPPQGAIEAMGSKSRSKEIMEAAGVPCVPGYHGENQDVNFLAEKADEITYPVLIKAVLGGGGKGMRIVNSKEEFLPELESAKSEARSAFGDDRVLVEKYIAVPRHVEVQVFADNHGNVVALGERDCSVQRRHQKILEESPAPGLDLATRQDLWAKARDAARAVGYQGAGTVEFIFDNESGKFYFMEMNTRLQVEHPVTESVTNVDLVEWQLLVAAGFPLPKTQEQISITGHAFETRIYCEDPDKGFLPSSGKIFHLQKPTSGSPRLDITFESGSTVSPLYDPMIGKLIVHGRNRGEAINKMLRALDELEIVGPVTNIDFVKRILKTEAFGGEEPSGLETGFIPNHAEELAQIPPVRNDVYAQAAIGAILTEQKPETLTSAFFTAPPSPWTNIQNRKVALQDLTTETDPAEVTVWQVDADKFVAEVNGEKMDIEARLLPGNKLFFKTGLRQAVNTFVAPAAMPGASRLLHVFDQGRHNRLAIVEPEWVTVALGGKAGPANSVVAPMPCKVTKVNVEAGQSVKKDDILIIIESMKMETTIRSPIDGVVKRVPHGPGSIVKQGIELIEFEDAEE